MLDISWGEIFVMGGLGMALAGRRDLPAASRFVGSQLGRVVGFLQGARARADQFAAQNELKQLQNELRSGLRELDQVKTELAVAASSQGMVGRTLGASVGSANRVGGKNNPTTNMRKPGGLPPVPPSRGAASMPPIAAAAAAPIFDSSVPTKDDSEFVTMEISDPTVSTPIDQLPYVASANLAPQAQSERAVMEEEWVKQGIGFRSRAETGEWMGNVPTEGTGGKTGSELLEDIIRQNLIFDQYDRVVGEQERVMQDRIESIKTKRKTGGSEAEDRKDK